MQPPLRTRRSFLKTSAAAGAIAAGLTSTRSARALGANERIRVGVIGIGNRSNYHIKWNSEVAKAQNVQIVAGCDVWRQKREAAGANIDKAFGVKPVLFEDYRELLEEPDIDAVLIATPDHQHCTQLIDAVNAGKDVYVEKPIAMNIDRKR